MVGAHDESFVRCFIQLEDIVRGSYLYDQDSDSVQCKQASIHMSL
jgi:hypothetical protein